MTPERTLADHPERAQLDGRSVTGSTPDSSRFEELYRRLWGSCPSGHDTGWPALLDRLAHEMVLRIEGLQTVLDASCGPGLLVRAFRRRGIAAAGADVSQEAVDSAPDDVRPWCRLRQPADPISERYDLAVCINVTRHLTEGSRPAYFRTLTAAADSVLFVETGDTLLRSRTAAVEWIHLFAGHGFAPDLEFHLSFLPGCTMLLRRKAAFPAEVVNIFAESLALRYRVMALQSGPEGVELARLRERVWFLENQLERERDYLNTLRGMHTYLLQEVRKPAQPASFAAAPSLASALPVDMEGLLARVRAEVSSSIAAVSRPVPETHPDSYAYVSRLESHIRSVERAVQNVNDAVNSILQSRIWRTLVSASGILLRLTGRGISSN